MVKKMSDYFDKIKPANIVKKDDKRLDDMPKPHSVRQFYLFHDGYDDSHDWMDDCLVIHDF